MCSFKVVLSQRVRWTKPYQGKCNRGIRLYELAYEAITRKLFDVIVSTKEENDWIQSNLNDINFATFWEHKISQTMCNKFLDAREKLKAGEPLQKFRMSFLEMVELLLNTIYAIRLGNWELLLECIRNILPYTFSYDNINYARYLTAILADMLQLPEDFPEVYKGFMNGNFAAQLTDGSKLSCVETDIEMTLNKDTKTPDGCTGFSTNVNAIKR